jgi:hypothetical protein
MTTSSEPSPALDFDCICMAFAYYFPTPMIPPGGIGSCLDALHAQGLRPGWSGVLRDGFKIVEDFFLPQRVRKSISRFELAALDFPSESDQPPALSGSKGRVLLTIYPDLNLASLTVLLTARGISSSEVIFLSQCFEGRHDCQVTLPTPSPAGATVVSLPAAIRTYVQWVCSSLGAEVPSGWLENLLDVHARIIEIRGVKGLAYCDPARLIDERPAEFVGLLGADEGWKYIPASEAKQRLQRNWRTRDFLTIHSAHRYLLVLDFSGQDACDYQNDQEVSAERFRVPMEEYFGPVPPLAETAGLLHGSFLTLESVCVQFYLLWFAYEDARHRTPSHLRDLLTLRKKLRKVWFNVLGFQNFEISAFEKIIHQSIAIPRAIQDFRSRIDDIEREIMLAYTRRTNLWIIALTIIGTLISSAALLLSTK